MKSRDEVERELLEEQLKYFRRRNANDERKGFERQLWDALARKGYPPPPRRRRRRS